jgi:hypothetical protein
MKLPDCVYLHAEFSVQTGVVFHVRNFYFYVPLILFFVALYGTRGDLCIAPKVLTYHITKIWENVFLVMEMQIVHTCAYPDNKLLCLRAER